MKFLNLDVPPAEVLADQGSAEEAVPAVSIAAAVTAGRQSSTDRNAKAGRRPLDVPREPHASERLPTSEPTCLESRQAVDHQSNELDEDLLDLLLNDLAERRGD